jgi:FkbH-like protein
MLDIVIAATYTCTPVVGMLEHLTRTSGLPARIGQAPYGQVVEQLLDPSSAFAHNQTGLNVCLIRPGDWNPAGSSRSDQRETLRLFAEAVQDFASRNANHLFIGICPETAGSAAPAGTGGERTLADTLSDVPGLAVVRVADWFETYGVADPFDIYADELARLPFTDVAFAALAMGLARVAGSLRTRPRKVIAVDCDYTLWGGACGDLDSAELVIDDRYRAVQRFLRDRYEQGFMLVICSRNDPENVERVFARRGADLELSAEHFVGRRINWGPKWDSLRSLAAELNVGVDSFVLVDDDPLVCAELGEALPSVGVVQLPVDADPVAILRRSAEFDRFFVTEEDRRRNTTYRADELRARESREVSSPAELNRRLDTVIEVRPAQRSDWRRMEQLVSRTNQFTCATMKPPQLIAALLDGCLGWVVCLRDRFGDYGVVAAAVAGPHDSGFELVNLVMSCRALGRGVAEALLDAVHAAAIEAGHPDLRVRLRPTGRNRLAVDFFTQRAERVDEDVEGHLLMSIAGRDRTELEEIPG